VISGITVEISRRWGVKEGIGGVLFEREEVVVVVLVERW
jgi:hypothetical protein